MPPASSLQPTAIVLVIDRLPAHLVGAYGNAWIRTPALDALAAESLLFEIATIDSPRLDLLYRSFWRGVHAARPVGVDDKSSPDLPSLLRGCGIRSLLVTDEPEVAELPLKAQFDELVRIDGSDEPATAESVEFTQLGRYFAAAADVIESATAPSLVWLHSQGLAGPWDAPLELRNFYADEEDPDPPTLVEPPNRMLAADHDPDERLGVSQAASGQITALDECLEGWLSAIDERLRGQETLLIVMGARGFPLGEHLRVGPCDEALYEELVHVPLLIRVPQSLSPLRTPALAQSADLFATLLDWFGCLDQRPGGQVDPRIGSASLLPLVANPTQTLRDRALTIVPGVAANQWTLRTSAWYLRHSIATEPAEEPRLELYVKPDDRFEVSDVARRCGEIVEELAAAGVEMLQAAGSGATGESIAPLPSRLVEVFE
ncbi:MAG: sulfatase-like hydrolase/transferase [Planctomycetes bacterium]|nr:sulfatase-like hydrolase/transferase [Planctomycetota bacterium]